MQSGQQRYGLQPDMQPFLGVRGSPQIFGHPQSVPSLSQTRSNVRPTREHLQASHQTLLHHAHIAQTNHQSMQQEYHDRHPQQSPTFHQSLNGLPNHHYLTPEPHLQHIVQQLRHDPRSPEISAAMTGKHLPNKTCQIVPGAQDPSNGGFRDERERELATNTWLSEETVALFNICSEMNASLRGSGGIRGALWEEVSRKLRDVGHQKSAKDCKEKFDDALKHHNMKGLKDCKEGCDEALKYHNMFRDGSMGRQDGMTFHLFREPEVIRVAGYNNYESRVSGGSSPDGLGVRSTTREDKRDTVEGRDGGSAPLADVTVGALDRSSDPEHACDIDERNRRKRRRRHSAELRLKLYFQNLTRQIIEQQEVLHNKFLETIEKQDRERLIRDEAYRRQESARLNREQELRSQELALAATRDAAVIAFLEKAIGRTVQLPKVVSPAILTTNLSAMQTTSLSEVREGKPKDAFDISAKRWPRVEVHALIRLRSGMEPRFQEAGPKAHLWQEISSSMAYMGFTRSAKRCKEKWENINKYFKKTKDICKKRPENAKTCPYFHQLDTLYRRGILASSSNKFKLLKSSSEDLPDNITENAGVLEDEKAEQLSILEAGEEGSNSSQAKGNSGVILSSGAGGILGNKPSDISSQRDGLQAHVESVRGKSSLRLEMFVKDILELQQQQHQKLVDEYDRMEQARDGKEVDEQQEQPISFIDEQAHSNNHDNGELTAVVHRFSRAPSDLAMSAPSDME